MVRAERVISALVMVLLSTLALLPTGCTSRTQPAISAEASRPSIGLPVFTDMVATSLEGASQITGYRVLGPATLPEGFHRYGVIDIIKTETESGNITYRVLQRWAWDEDQSVLLTLTQDPELDGIGGGEPTQIGKWPAQRALTRPIGGEPGSLNLYWKIQDMAFAIGACLVGPLDEATVTKIAVSLSAN